MREEIPTQLIRLVPRAHFAYMAKMSVFMALIFAFNPFWGCKEIRYTPDDEFVDLYAQLKLASVASNQDLGKANEVRKVILAQHGVTAAEFHERFVRLVNHPDAWKAFQDRVINRVNTLQKERKGEFNGQ